MNQENKNPNNDRTLEEQEAPLKNTDHAFVQVSKDGSPRIPETTDEENRKDEKNKSTTTLGHR